MERLIQYTVSIKVETNKDTIEETFDSLEEMRDYIERNFEEEFGIHWPMPVEKDEQL